ncbi:beta family protein [Methylocystis rosea]|uniref:Uncharacterized protein n=1 Tax=Methylocystis rosea TaxID=173366 RepID=A0A3G8M8G0_9HYPH|nr:hypothetical protein [Methylocystis rosea]AZG77360.1 hypothetical protein EHO51_11785 [Methylocystis rosea]
MIDSFTVEHYEHVSHRSFEDVVAAFEAELGVSKTARFQGRWPRRWTDSAATLATSSTSFTSGAGDGFSNADAFIARVANDPAVGPGNSTTWRQLNTTHHITQLVSDIAKVRGISIKKAPASEEVRFSLID